MKQLHSLPHDFRTRLNSSELRDVGKEYLKAQNKQAVQKNGTRTHGLTPNEFEQVMQNLGFLEFFSDIVNTIPNSLVHSFAQSSQFIDLGTFRDLEFVVQILNSNC